MPKKPSEFEQLSQQLAAIHSQLVKQNSLLLSFVRGLMTGLGASVGVTVILGVIVFILTQIARAFGLETMLQNLTTELSQMH